MPAISKKKLTFDEWESVHQRALMCLYLDFLKNTKPESNNCTLQDFERFMFDQAKHGVQDLTRVQHSYNLYNAVTPEPNRHPL